MVDQQTKVDTYICKYWKVGEGLSPQWLARIAAMLSNHENTDFAIFKFLRKFNGLERKRDRLKFMHSMWTFFPSEKYVNQINRGQFGIFNIIFEG